MKTWFSPHGTEWQAETYEEALEQERDALVEQLEAAQREADIQLGQKLAAQMTLKAVCDALNLPMVSLGNGWTEATPKILARIEEIVDEGERGFRERDELERAYRQACTNLATIRPDLTRDLSIGETADLYYDALLAGWGGIEGYDSGRVSEPSA